MSKNRQLLNGKDRKKRTKNKTKNKKLHRDNESFYLIGVRTLKCCYECAKCIHKTHKTRKTLYVSTIPTKCDRQYYYYLSQKSVILLFMLAYFMRRVVCCFVFFFFRIFLTLSRSLSPVRLVAFSSIFVFSRISFVLSVGWLHVQACGNECGLSISVFDPRLCGFSPRYNTTTKFQHYKRIFVMFFIVQSSSSFRYRIFVVVVALFRQFVFIVISFDSILSLSPDSLLTKH